MYPGLQGKTALITGGTSGIGQATAIAAARSGVHVVITGRRVAEGEAVAAEIRTHGVKGVFVQSDVTNESQIIKAVDAAVALNGKLDFAFNNAGFEGALGPTTEASADVYRQVFDINVLGVMLSMKHELRAMLKSGSGSIVNTASIAGRIGMANVGTYVASKHAVLGLTKCAAMEVAKQNIRVNAVSPAAIDTAMFDRFTGDRNPEATSYMASLHPIGRIGKPDEIAHPVLFLFSDAAGFMTGHDLLVDGGLCVP